jgi:hypothetical protein
VVDGVFWFKVLSVITKEGKGKTNEEIFNEVKKYMQHVDPNLTPMFLSFTFRSFFKKIYSIASIHYSGKGSFMGNLFHNSRPITF